MNSKNTLVTSFGTTWQIVPELIGYLNHEDFPFYQNHPQWQKIQLQLQTLEIPPVDQLFLIHTDSPVAQNAIEKVEKWKKSVHFPLPNIEYFSYDNVSDLFDPEECRQMTDLTLRTILYAKERLNGGKLILSLAGGRKTMSADMQWGSEIFGCHAMIHIADSIPSKSDLKEQNNIRLFLQPLAETLCKQLYPMVVFNQKPAHSLTFIDRQIKTSYYSVHPGKNPASETFYNHISKGVKETRNLLFHHYQNQNQKSMQTSFRGLQLLGADKVHQLQNELIASDFMKQKEDMAWLNALPKAELHCHLGGVLDCRGLLSVAKTLRKEVAEAMKSNRDFEDFLNSVAGYIQHQDHLILQNMIHQSKERIRNQGGVSDPLAVAGFLQQFDGDEELLEKLIYADYLRESEFAGIEFKGYETLGDLQGTGILKHPATLKKTCELLKEYCKKHHVTYLELRCSPANYVTKNFSLDDVMQVLFHSLSDCQHTHFRLIIIASRHKDSLLIKSHVDYVVQNIENKEFNQFFAGFDVAGDEREKTPSQIKTALNDLLKQSIQMTIHAGETVAVKSVWGAVYDLNADRIGHGLTLGEDQRLLNRFVNRRITVEMCPSSNYQIIGYRDFRFDKTERMKIYPLADYFSKGVRVTINTDNPGISRTNLTYEYYKAACMSKGGISKWDILKIARNGFIGAFVPYGQKKMLLLEAEKQLSQIV
ncbi:MAG: hypothetical protein ACOCUQ_03035 [Bacteroidota bacterium]